MRLLQAHLAQLSTDSLKAFSAIFNSNKNVHVLACDRLCSLIFHKFHYV